jgi:hypothetical protein
LRFPLSTKSDELVMAGYSRFVVLSEDAMYRALWRYSGQGISRIRATYGQVNLKIDFLPPFEVRAVLDFTTHYTPKLQIKILELIKE